MTSTEKVEVGERRHSVFETNSMDYYFSNFYSLESIQSRMQCIPSEKEFLFSSNFCISERLGVLL